MIARELGLFLVLAAILPLLWFETVGWQELPDASQTAYTDGVPHTEANGKPRVDFDADRSFFPVGIYHALTGDWHGRTYELSEIRAAGFNTVHLWEGQSFAAAIKAVDDAELQVIHHYPTDDDVRRFAGHRSVLSWYLDEEPTLRFPLSDQEEYRSQFASRREQLREVDPERPVHIVAGPPRFFAEWDQWAGIGDVVAFSVYPARAERQFELTGTRAIADSVTRAVDLGRARKPVWFVAQAFASPKFGWRMPTPGEYRAMVYTAIVHGATGVITFAYDSFVTRDGQVLGIASDPIADHGTVPDYDRRNDAPLVVDAAARAASRELWHHVGAVNRELTALAPALLSPTLAVPYRVSVLGWSDVETPIRTLLKRDAESEVLIVVNVSARSLNARFAFDDAIAKLRRPFAPDDVVVVDGGWKTHLAPFETKIFRFELSPAGKSIPGPQS